MMKRSRILCISMLFGFISIAGTSGTGLIFEEPQFSFQALRTIGYSVNGFADIGECLSTCRRIVDGDLESWYREWLSTAESVERKAKNYLEDGFLTSAGECFFRSSGYYRAAGFFLTTNPDDPAILETWIRSRDAFLAGAALSNQLIVPVEIPFEDSHLPGYLCLVDDSGNPGPLILAHSGFDGTKEELYFSLGSYAIERGYNCLLFEGPGQGEVLHMQNIHFRPDWESVIEPVVDYAECLPVTDPDKLILIGYSMGGYFAPRAASGEPRITACIANGGIFSVYESVRIMNPPDLDEILDDSLASLEYDGTIYSMMDENLFINWYYGNGMMTFGENSPSELIRALRAYTMDGLVRDISCRMLILDSENDQLVSGQASVLFDSLRCPKDYIMFTEEEGADQHCQMGAILVSNERIFNWLDDNFQNTGQR